MKEDLRVQKTKQAIRKAFITLLKEKEFSSITVQNIADKAQISRSTFYDHYGDKYILLESMYVDVIKRFQEISDIYFTGRSQQDKARLARNTLGHVLNDAETFKVLLSMKEPGWDLFTRIQKAMEPRCMEYLEKESQDRFRLGKEYVAGVYTYMMTYSINWLAEHRKEEDIQGMLKVASTISSYFFEGKNK